MKVHIEIFHLLQKLSKLDLALGFYEVHPLKMHFLFVTHHSNLLQKMALYSNTKGDDDFGVVLKIRGVVST